MFIGTRVFSDTLAQQALDRELFEAVSSERGRLWGTVASVLARGANPNAIMHLAAPLAPLGNPLTYLTFTERKRGWMRQDILEACDAPVGYWGSTTAIGALLTMGSVAAKDVEAVADDADPYAHWTFFQDGDLYEVLFLLLDNGADPNAIYSQHVASINPGHKHKVIYQRDASPLSDAVSYLLCRCSELLLAYGADPLRRCPEDKHIFDSINTEHRNAELTRSQLRIIKLLIDAGCAFGEHGPEPWGTLLGQAAAILNLPLVEGLLALGADPNAVDAWHGNSPLHQIHSLPEPHEDTFADELDVAQTRHLTHKIAEALLAAGADPTIRNRAGKTATGMGNAALSMSIDLFWAEKERDLVGSHLPLEGARASIAVSRL